MYEIRSEISELANRVRWTRLPPSTDRPTSTLFVQIVNLSSIIKKKKKRKKENKKKIFLLSFILSLFWGIVRPDFYEEIKEKIRFFYFISLQVQKLFIALRAEEQKKTTTTYRCHCWDYLENSVEFWGTSVEVCEVLRDVHLKPTIKYFCCRVKIRLHASSRSESHRSLRQNTLWSANNNKTQHWRR